MSNSRLALIIPAAGSGERLGTTVPKPYLKLADKTILEHTLTQFLQIHGLQSVVVSTSDKYIKQTETILSRLFPDITTQVVLGGVERQHSIMNALSVISSDDIDLVAIHDAVRPFVDQDSIRNCIELSSKVGGAIVAVSAKDTIKVSDEGRFVLQTPDRKSLWQAQTPQIFRIDLIKRAYQQAQKDGFLGTDDSSLVEHLGGKVAIVEGNRENFKITYPLDFKLAEWLIEKNNG